MGKNERAPNRSQRLTRTERRALERKQKKELSSKSFWERHAKKLYAGAVATVGGATIVGGVIFSRGQDGRTPLPPTAIAQQTNSEQSQKPIILTPTVESSPKLRIGAEIYKAFPELEQLPERQSEVIKIDKTNLEILNLSNIDINFQTVSRIYKYVNGVAHQFQQNRWYYPHVNFYHNNQPEHMDIYVRPSVAEKRGLVLLPEKYEMQSLNISNVKGATIVEPFEITFIRVPRSADTDITQLLPSFTDETETIRVITVEACQSSVFVSSPQDTIPRSTIAHETFCNSQGWHVALAQTGSSIEEAKNLMELMEESINELSFNPLPPDQKIYPQIPKFESLFSR